MSTERYAKEFAAAMAKIQRGTHPPTPKSLHQEAMALLDAAEEARRAQSEDADVLLGVAAVLAVRAAEMLASRHDDEPSRSVLFRSAATLVGRLGLWREAVRLARLGLEGSQVPPEIAEELRDIIRQAARSIPYQAEVR